MAETSYLTSRVITLIVAIVVVAVVLIPITDSLTKSDFDTGTGTGGTAEYTNEGTYHYARADSDTHLIDVYVYYPSEVIYKTVTRISTDGVFSPDFIVTYGDIGEIEDTRCSLIFGTCAVAIPDVDIRIIFPIEGENVGTEEYLPYDTGAEFDDIGEEGLSNCHVYKFKVQNGVFSVDYSRYITLPDPQVDINVPIDYYIAPNGDYVLATENVAVDVNDTFDIVGTEVDENFAQIIGEASGHISASSLVNSTIIPDGSLKFYDLYGGVNSMSITGTADTTVSDGLLHINSITATVEITLTDDPSEPITETIDTWVYIVPEHIGGSDSGSDSESGAVIDGTTATIIKIIPIFVLLGIFVGLVVPLVSNRFE